MIVQRDLTLARILCRQFITKNPKPATIVNDIPNQVSVALIQQQCSADVEANLSETISQIETASKSGAQLICLQELFASQYFCQSTEHKHFELAESIPGPTTERLSTVAAKLGVVIVAGLFERRASGVFHNTAVVIDSDGTIAGKYRKMHIPDDPFFHEKFYFTPGDLGFQSIQTSVGKIGVCICWDQWFPEAARLTALKGAEILIYPTAIGWLEEDKKDFGPSQLNAWQTVMRSHAITNGVYLIAPNRVGTESKIQFWGSSFVVDPYGDVLVRASDTESEVLVTEIDLSIVETARTHWPFLRDRRIDAYDDITTRWIDNDTTDP